MNSIDKKIAEDLMKQCQRGVAGSGRAIEVANNLLAECYGVIGVMLADNDRLQKSSDHWKAMHEAALDSAKAEASRADSPLVSK